MVARVSTVAFQGIEAVPVDVQVMIAPGKANIHIVGLGDKAVAESRERVQAALHASGLSMPAKKVTVNLAPADLPKEGSHYDLAIALGLMAALGAIPGDALSPYVVIGELSLDGTIAAVAGCLPAAIGANAMGKGLICPEETGAEALGHATGDAEHGARLEVAAKLTQPADHALLRVLADGAGVHQHDVGVVRGVLGRVALGGELAVHELGVAHVHLAAVGLDVYRRHCLLYTSDAADE